MSPPHVEMSRSLHGTLWEKLWEAGLQLQALITCPSRKDAWTKVGTVLKDALAGGQTAVWGVESYWEISKIPTTTLRRMLPDSPPHPEEDASSHNVIPDVELIQASDPEPDSPAHKLVAHSFRPESWTTAIVVRLRDHKARLQGVVTVADPAAAPEDELLPFAERIARKCGHCIEQGRALYLVTELRRQLKAVENFQDVLRRILRYAISLVGADRGDIGYWNWDHDGGEGAFGLIKSEDRWLEEQWQPHELSGVLLKVWSPDGEDFCCGHLDAETDYDGRDAGIRSALVVRLDQQPEQVSHASKQSSSVRKPRRRIAVVNLESESRDAFDKTDRELLHVLLDRACDDFKLVGLWLDFRQIIGRLTRSDNLQDTGRVILESIRAAFGFDRGIIYYPDYSRRQLLEFGMIGVGEDKRGFSHSLVEDDPDFKLSFAHWIFHKEKEDYVPNALDPTEWERRVSAGGVRRFGITGPMIGLRLVGSRDEAVGAMVLWSSENNPAPEQWHLRELQPLSQLAGLALRAHLAQERQMQFREAVGRILREMQETLDLKRNLKAVMDGIQAVGIERVRVFACLPGGRTKGLYSQGMGKWAFEKRPEDSPYIASIHPEDGAAYNPYVKELVERINQRQDDLLAQIQPRPGDHDPHCLLFGKAADTQWVDVPLVSAGKLYGELAVDNRSTRRPLTETDKMYVSVFGALAARAFAIDEKRGMLNAEAVAQLYRRAVLEHGEHTLFRVLVRFLRHENGGLGFTYAIFLKAEHSSRRFSFCDAAGQLDTRTGREVDLAVRDHTLGKVLDELLASGVYAGAQSGPAKQLADDSALCKALANYRVSYDHPTVQPFLAEASQPGIPRAAPPTVRPFLEDHLLEILGNDARPLAAAVSPPAFSDLPLAGLLVVGRSWGRPVGDADRDALATFAQEAGHLVSFRDLYHKSLADNALANYGLLVPAFRGEIRGPKNKLKIAAQILPTINAQLPPEDARVLEAIRQEVVRIQEVTEAVDALADANREPWLEAELEDLFAELRRRATAEAGASAVRLGMSNRFGTTLIPVKKQLLLLALTHLIRNACEAFLALGDAGPLSAEGPRPLIEVDLTVESGRLAFSVSDNGPGLSERTWERLREGRPVTTKPGREMGFGLPICRRVAWSHNNGNVAIERRSPGVRVVICYHPPDQEAIRDRPHLH